MIENIRFKHKKLENWKKLKPIRRLIEDFFKVCKDAFGLGKFHAYTQSSMRRNIYLCILLSTLVIQQGFDTKTKLQQLAEGRIDLEPIKSRKSKKLKKKKKKQKIKKWEKKLTHNQHSKSKLENK